MIQWRLDPGQIEVMDKVAAKMLRGKTPAQRITMIGEAHETAKSMLRASIRRHHPQWDDAAVTREVVRRLLGETA